MKKPIAIAATILISTPSLSAENDLEIVWKAAGETDLIEKLNACLKREPLNREFILTCMMAATHFAEVNTYTRKPREDEE